MGREEGPRGGSICICSSRNKALDSGSLFSPFNQTFAYNSLCKYHFLSLSHTSFRCGKKSTSAVQMEVMLTNTLLTCALPTLLASTQDVAVPLVAIETKVKGDQSRNDGHKVVDAAEEGGDGDNNVENGDGEFEDGEDDQFSDEGVHENNPNKTNGNAKKSNDEEGEENGDAEDEEGDGEGHDDDDNNDDDDDNDNDDDDDDDGEGPDEEEVVEEEPEDEEEEDEEEETIQPPKKRKK
ncbi:protein bfr2-like [Nicotiana tomentosiformis]|uniref:protein bfr2-like n=1 Tax=Nicotiana tomentosiformis TaxID=4098 RepID=UPI00051B25FF|nr:prostatic spermine-binding protein-like [Nicotiana tomentosiformis]